MEFSKEDAEMLANITVRINGLEKIVDEMKRTKADVKDIDLVKMLIEALSDKLDDLLTRLEKKDRAKIDWVTIVILIGQLVIAAGMFLLAFK